MRSMLLAACLALILLSCPPAVSLTARGRPSPPRFSPPRYSAPQYRFPAYRGVPHHFGNFNRRLPNVRLVQVNTDVTFSYNAAVGKVRTVDPPEGFDEKGNLKKYTREELKQFKGDTPEEKKLAGYKADFSELRTGDVVQVLLSVHKDTVAQPSKKLSTGPKANANPDADNDATTTVGEKPPEMGGGKWVVATQLIGRVTKVNTRNTASAAALTIRVTTVQPVVGRTRMNGNRKHTVQPNQAQATLILIARRPTGR